MTYKDALQKASSAIVNLNQSLEAKQRDLDELGGKFESSAQMSQTKIDEHKNDVDKHAQDLANLIETADRKEQELTENYTIAKEVMPEFK